LAAVPVAAAPVAAASVAAASVDYFKAIAGSVVDAVILSVAGIDSGSA